MSESSATAKLVERLFWWLVGIFGALFTMAISAVVSALWNMNGSIITLNERVGMVVERMVVQEQNYKNLHGELQDYARRLEALEIANQTKRSRK